MVRESGNELPSGVHVAAEVPVAAQSMEAEPSEVGFAGEWQLEHEAARPLTVEWIRSVQSVVGLLEPGIAETQLVVVELSVGA